LLVDTFILQCGVPKKGHVCPYQPKVKRRSGEEAPEMKSAAIQVEMDEVGRIHGLTVCIFSLYPVLIVFAPAQLNIA
jgi:hypothetical protein